MVNSVCALPDGDRVVSGSWDNTLRVWDAKGGTCERVLEGHGKVSEVSFFPFHLLSLAIFHHLQDVTTVCLLSNGSRVVSGSVGKGRELVW
jgi:hypothetical protein